jgi:hypothetical protein
VKAGEVTEISMMVPVYFEENCVILGHTFMHLVCSLVQRERNKQSMNIVRTIAFPQKTLMVSQCLEN